MWGEWAEGLGRKNRTHRVGLSLRQPSSIPPCVSAAFPEKAQGSHLRHPNQQARPGSCPRSPASPAPRVAGEKAILGKKVCPKYQIPPPWGGRGRRPLQCGACKVGASSPVGTSQPQSALSSQPKAAALSRHRRRRRGAPHPFQPPMPRLRSHIFSDFLWLLLSQVYPEGTGHLESTRSPGAVGSVLLTPSSLSSGCLLLGLKLSGGCPALTE